MHPLRMRDGRREFRSGKRKVFICFFLAAGAAGWEDIGLLTNVGRYRVRHLT